jgi:hypothetical protein
LTARASHRPDTGLSPTAEAFGAEISTPERERSLFFVIGRDGPPDAIVRSIGGTVVTHLQDRRRVLAVAPLAAHAALRQNRDLELAGPVSIDPERFERFTRLVGLNNDPRPSQALQSDSDVSHDQIPPAQETPS